MKQKPINIAIIVIIALLLATVLYAKLTQSGDGSLIESAPVSGLAARQIAEGKEAGESMWLLFGSDTCPYCVELDKIYERLQPQYEGKIRFIDIDVNDQENAQLVRQYDVSYIPATFIIDNEGKISYVQVGLMPEEELRAELDKVVN